jgi:hypothetical protein
MVAINTLLCLLGLSALETLANPIGMFILHSDLMNSNPAQVAGY